MEIDKLDYNADNKVDFEEIMRMGMHKKVKEDLAVGIAWIGHTLDPDYKPHKEIIKERIKLQTAHEISDSEDDSNSKMYPWFELTYYGEPICLNEYLCEAANYPQVHILHLDDVQHDLGLRITKDCVKQDNSQPHTLEDRSGRERMIFIRECAIDQVRLFLQNRKKLDSRVFCFPDNLDQLGILRHVWANV